MLLTVFWLTLALRHDTWIWPSEWEDGCTWASVRTGNRFPVSEVATKPERIARTYGIEPDAVWVQDDSELACRGVCADIVGVVLHPAPIILERADFRDYMLHEGHPFPADLDGPQPETYTKCAKALVKGESAEAIGQPIEIVGTFGEFVAVRYGRPNPEARLRAYSTDGEDVESIGSLRLPRPGAWMIRTHHISRVEGGWESLWASLTVRFEVKP